MTVHPLHNLAINDLNHKLVACKIHKPSNNITVWVAFQRFHLTIILIMIDPHQYGGGLSSSSI